MKVTEKVVTRLKWVLLTLVIFFDLILIALNFMADKGVPEANAFLGYLYKNGVAVFPKDAKKAKDYFLIAAKKGDVEAQCDIGEIYAREQSYNLAGYYYLTAALNGSQRCEVHFLKLSYPDEKIIFEFLKKKADKNNNPAAQFMVGKRLIEAVGVSKDTNAGITYLQKAVSQGHWGAKLYLAGIYIKGELLPQDIDKANELMGIKNKLGEKK